MHEEMELVPDDYPELVDSEHLGMVLDGAIDTIVGAETLTGAYTKAQQYLFSCLCSSDTIDYKTQRGGLENFISDAASGIWEFITKIFKSVWNFFFGGDSSEKSVGGTVDKAEKTIKKNKEALQDLSKTGKPEAEVKATADGVKKGANKIKNKPSTPAAAKKDAEEIIKKIDDAKDKPLREQEAVIKAAAVELRKLNKEGEIFLNERITESDNKRNSFIERVKKNDIGDLAEGRWKYIYETFLEELRRGAFGTHPLKEIVNLSAINTVEQATAVQEKLNQEMEVHRRFSKKILGEKEGLEGEIKILKDELAKKNVKKGDRYVLGDAYKDKNDLSKRLGTAKKVLQLIADVGGYQVEMANAVMRLSIGVKSLYGDFTPVDWNTGKK